LSLRLFVRAAATFDDGTVPAMHPTGPCMAVDTFGELVDSTTVFLLGLR